MTTTEPGGDDPVAIVTGYSSGLGLALTTGLLASGWTVVGVSRGLTAPAPEETGERLFSVVGPAENDETADAAFALAQSKGRPQLVINCAGQGVFGPPGSYSGGDIRAVLAGNLAALILFSDKAVPLFAGTGGAIVNVMSTAGKKLRTNELAYCAAKWGAKAYTRGLREALKAQKSPIRVFEVYPCGMQTAFWDSAIRPASDGAEFPRPEDIAPAILRAVLEPGSVYTQELVFERR